MKELSIEEKAKAYDEALEIARKINSGEGVEAPPDWSICEVIFPELKESEDEKIRKELISFLQLPHLQFVGERKQERWLAWVEKQGEQKPAENIKLSVFKDKLLELFQRFGWYCKDKTQTDEDIIEYIDAHIQELIDTIQKSADNVEPKFKVGDWVVYNRNDSSREILYVYDIRDGRYYFNDNIHFSWSVKECDKKCHLWSIEDAKDGDVLAESKGDVILMFRGIGNIRWDDVIDYHFYYDCYRENFIVQEDVNYWGNTENNQLKPATKEQRDALMKAMADAGYTFDFEKKELKKIGQGFKEKSIIPSLKDFQEAFELKARQYDIELPHRGYDIYAMCKELYSLLIKAYLE